MAAQPTVAASEISDFDDPSTYPQYPQFNSTKNHPVAGFTPDFASIGEVQEDGTIDWNDQDFITLKPGATYAVSIYYENDAPLGTNETDNARVWVDFPSVVKSGEEIKGTVNIMASNTIHQSIWSTITFSSEWGGDIALRYIRGSAKLVYVKANNPIERELPNDGIDLFNPEGQLIGSDFDGKVKGGVEDQAYIQFQMVADYPDFEIGIFMRKSSAEEWQKTISAGSGERFWTLLEYSNTGSIQQNDVVLKSILPAGMTYVVGTSYLVNSTYPEGFLMSDHVTEGIGVNVGNYASGSNALVMFQVEVGNMPFKTREIKARVETNNGTKTVATGVDTREQVVFELTEPSMDDPKTHFTVSTTSALLVAIFVAVFSLGANLIERLIVRKSSHFHGKDIPVQIKVFQFWRRPRR